MDSKFYFSLMFFLFSILMFPIVYDASLNANITNTNILGAVQIFPYLLIVFTGVVPLLMWLGEKN